LRSRHGFTTLVDMRPPWGVLFPLLLALPTRAPAQRAPDPRAIIREAERAVKERRAPTLERQWDRALAQHPDDAADLFAKATLERLTYRYADATRDYDRIRALSPSAGGVFRAFAALGESDIASNAARLAEASAAGTAALTIARASHYRSAEVLARLVLGALRLRDAPPAVALALFDSAVSLVPARDIDLRARARCYRATALARTSKPEAVTEAKAGAKLARRAGALRIVALCLHVAASGYERLGRYYSADRLFDTAGRLARSLGDRRELASILQWRGYAAFEREQVDSAQRLLGEAREEAEATGSTSVMAWSSLNLAQVSIALDDPVSAESYVARALTLMRQLGDQWGTTTALGYVAALALQTGDVERADTLFRELESRASQGGDASTTAQLDVSLASIAARRRDWPRALALLDSASAAFRRAGYPAAPSTLPYEHGVIALWRNQVADADRLLRAALEQTDSSEHVTRYIEQSRLAAARLAAGDTVGAEHWLAVATDEVDGWRRGLSDSTLRVLAFQIADRFGGPDLGTASVLGAVATSGHIAPAFELAERRRARLLHDRLLRTREAALASRGSRVAIELDATHLTLAAVARALPANAALVDLITGRGGQPTTAIVITRRDAFAVSIAPIDSMRADIARLLAIIQAGNADTVIAARLGEATLGAVVRRLPAGITNLVLLPEDALHRVPFAALIVGHARIAERFAVHEAPSGAVALSLWSNRPPPGPVRMLAFGGAPFPLDDERNPPATRAFFAGFASNGGLTALAASATEAREAARRWPRSLALVGADASEANLKRIPLAQYRLLHLATHAQVDERAPGRSAIALAAGGGEDGFVTSADLARLRLNADLVTLSGCSTALGVLVDGEGILGLTGPLLQAGAHSVVATLWPVNDRASAEFVRRFYGFLASGSTAIEALRLAQLDAIRRDLPTRDWAAFALTGDGFIRVSAATVSQ
jgi:tetratricopeptide (TPR) repeat protein